MYNGHESYNAWNVSLWISNDEGLYLLAKGLLRKHKTKKAAASAMMSHFKDLGIDKTPDGVKYSERKILLAMRGL